MPSCQQSVGNTVRYIQKKYNERMKEKKIYKKKQRDDYFTLKARPLSLITLLIIFKLF